MNRRRFLSTAAVGFPYVTRNTVLGANDRIEIGFVGVGRRASYLIQHEDFGEKLVYLIRRGDTYRILGEEWQLERDEIAKTEVITPVDATSTSSRN